MESRCSTTCAPTPFPAAAQLPSMAIAALPPPSLPPPLSFPFHPPPPPCPLPSTAAIPSTHLECWLACFQFVNDHAYALGPTPCWLRPTVRPARTFIATILVPQKKKGDTSSAAPNSCINGPPSPDAAAAAAVLGAAGPAVGLAAAVLLCVAAAAAASSSGIKHCTSIPVATHSTCGACPLLGAGCWVWGLASSSEM